MRWFYNEIPEPPAIKSSGLSNIVESLDDTDNRWWSDDDRVWRHLTMMSEAHRCRVEALINGQQFTYRTFFRRRRNGWQRAEVRDDDLAGCLRTATGGSAKQFLIKAGKGIIKMRAMTPRELARLQGVPDKYPIIVNDVQAINGFGDAVCVPVISWVAEHVLIPLLINRTRSYKDKTTVMQPILLKDKTQQG